MLTTILNLPTLVPALTLKALVALDQAAGKLVRRLTGASSFREWIARR